jgi:hypothetical protein
MNELLLWMSARRSGSAQSFRARVAALYPVGSQLARSSAAYWQAVWGLSKLGHAEFAESAGGRGWRVAPPVLAAGDFFGPPRAVLCGARTEGLRAALINSAGGDRVSTLPQSGAPDTVEVRASSTSALDDIARRTRIPIQWNAPLAILAVCPTVKAAPVQERTIPVGAGWSVTRFSKSSLAWVGASAAEAQQTASGGFFRFRADYGTTYILKEGGRAWSCDPAIGKYRVLTRRHRPLAYLPATQELSISAACRPPDLVERALVVGSGRLPEFRAGRIVYGQVVRAAAEAAASLLGQRLY